MGSRCRLGQIASALLQDLIASQPGGMPARNVTCEAVIKYFEDGVNCSTCS